MTIIVTGGYGAVGRAASTALGAWFPGDVLATGRNIDKARQLTAATGNTVLPAQVDLTHAGELEHLLDDARVLVACTEHDNARIAETCLRRGIHYVDVSASHTVLTEIERLDDLARRHSAAAVLSVGLAPGLTNLLAADCARRLDTVRGIDIAVLLGLGERHGRAAVEWTLDTLRARPPHARPQRVRFPGEPRSRTAYPFDFSDQHTLRRTLGTPTTTRLCFDSRVLSRLLFLSRNTGALRALRSPGLRHVFAAAIPHLHIGSDAFAVTVDAHGDDRTVTMSISGHDQSHVSGLVAAHVARQLNTGAAPSGVVHIDQFTDLDTMTAALREHGLVTDQAEPHDGTMENG